MILMDYSHVGIQKMPVVGGQAVKTFYKKELKGLIPISLSVLETPSVAPVTEWTSCRDEKHVIFLQNWKNLPRAQMWDLI